jgi:hypothetical protein
MQLFVHSLPRANVFCMRGSHAGATGLVVITSKFLFSNISNILMKTRLTTLLGGHCTTKAHLRQPRLVAPSIDPRQHSYESFLLALLFALNNGTVDYLILQSGLKYTSSRHRDFYETLCLRLSYEKFCHHSATGALLGCRRQSVHDNVLPHAVESMCRPGLDRQGYCVCMCPRNQLYQQHILQRCFFCL